MSKPDFAPEEQLKERVELKAEQEGAQSNAPILTSAQGPAVHTLSSETEEGSYWSKTGVTPGASDARQTERSASEYWDNQVTRQPAGSPGSRQLPQPNTAEPAAIDAAKQSRKNRIKLLWIGSFALASTLVWSNVSTAMKTWALTDRKCPALVRTVFGGTDLVVAEARNGALALAQQHHYPEAEAMLERVMGKPSSLKGDAGATLATIYVLDNKIDKAQDVVQTLCADTNPRCAASMLHYMGAPSLFSSRNSSLARVFLQRAAKIFKETGGEMDKCYVKEQLFLAHCDAAEDKKQLALNEYERLLPLLEKLYGTDDQYTVDCRNMIEKVRDAIQSGKKLTVDSVTN
jgi:hypothetical protein